MAKSSDDAPTISMRVEKGRLVPVSQYDRELLDQWHEGAELNVEAKRITVRPLEKKYRAMLSHLIKTADTPWSNPITAHEAMKMAAGFVTPFKKKDGTWGAHPRSLATFDDAELNEFFAIFEGVVQRRFGIDPETLRKEAPDTGSSNAVTPVPELDGSPDVSTSGVGVEESPTPPNPGEGDAGAGDGGAELTPQIPSSSARLSNADLQWLKAASRMLVSASSPGGDVDILLRQASAIKGEIPALVTRRARDLLNQVFKHCLHVTRDSAPFDKKLVATVAGCEVSDLRSEAR